MTSTRSILPRARAAAGRVLVTRWRRKGWSTGASKLLAAGWIDSDPIGRCTSEADPRLAALADAGCVVGSCGSIACLIYDAARLRRRSTGTRELRLALVDTRARAASRPAARPCSACSGRPAIEDLAGQNNSDALDEAEQRFVADAIMLLSTDMFLPDTAEALITATLAYRVLAEDGHPRIADNAHWRLYDHVRGVLEGAVEIAPAMRADVLVHALYAEREDISPWLDVAPPLAHRCRARRLVNPAEHAMPRPDALAGVLAAGRERDQPGRDSHSLLPRPQAWRR
jgi:hypothetical protein